MIDSGSIVAITKPRYSGGGRSFFQDKQARVVRRKGRMLTLVLSGETEQYMFWISEVEER